MFTTLLVSTLAIYVVPGVGQLPLPTRPVIPFPGGGSISPLCSGCMQRACPEMEILPETIPLCIACLMACTMATDHATALTTTADGCTPVTHLYDNPGWLTCECVAPDDQCFSDKHCVPSPSCNDCHPLNNDWGCCTQARPCNAGFGDCDYDSDCVTNYCVHDDPQLSTLYGANVDPAMDYCAIDASRAQLKYEGCFVGNTVVRPFGDVSNDMNGVEDCRKKCYDAGYAFFGMECPRSTVHCECADVVDGVRLNDDACMQFNHASLSHCSGPFTASGSHSTYSLGTGSIGSLYSTQLIGNGVDCSNLNDFMSHCDTIWGPINNICAWGFGLCARTCCLHAVNGG